MITFSTRTVPAMSAVMAALIADGNPTQLVGRKRKVATTTADRETLLVTAKRVSERIYIERTGLEHRTVGNYLTQEKRS